MRNAQSHTVLLVEDQAIIALSEAGELERLGYRVLLAHTGVDAVRSCLTNQDIDLVLMDIDLGAGINGAQAAEEILCNRNLPVLFLSSHTEPEVVLKTEQITSYGYVVKSAGIVVLDASIQMAYRLFEAKQRASENEAHYRALFDNGHTVIF